MRFLLSLELLLAEQPVLMICDSNLKLVAVK